VKGIEAAIEKGNHATCQNSIGHDVEVATLAGRGMGHAIHIIIIYPGTY